MSRLRSLVIVLAVATVVLSGTTSVVVAGHTQAELTTDTASIATTDEPTAAFDYSPSNPNPDDEITLDASGSTDNGTIESYEWDTNGDGEYSDYRDDAADGQTTSVTFDSGGTYTVGLRVTDDNGNTDTATTTISVENPAPEANFDYSPSVPNPDDEVTLDASGSTDEDGTIESYEWDTNGDGEYSDYRDDAADGQTTSVTFESGGTYTVGLRVEDNGGETDTVSKQITVDNPAPEASFEFTPSGPNPDDEISLDASSSTDTDGEIVSYEWDTNGDGEYSDYRDDAADGQTTTVTFGTGGTYTVSLRVEDNGGKTATTTQQITVDNPAPTSDFEFTPSSPNPDDEITLDASGSSDPDGTIESYEWDTNGDGEYSDYRDDAADGQTTSVTFDTGGTYTVGLRVEDNGGKTETTTQQITVDNPAPTADFDISPIPPNPDDEITLDAARSSDPDGTIESYEWDTNGDGEYGDYRDDAADGQTTTVSYDSAGEYRVGLRVTDNGGVTDTDQFIITVENPAPTAAFSVTPEDPNPDDEISLDAGESSDPDGAIESYEWDTNGDGEFGGYRDAGDGERTTVDFDTGGTYEVGLRVGDNGEKYDTTTREITVDNPAPTASIAYAPDVPELGESVAFDGTSSSDPDGEVVSYRWYVNGNRIARGEMFSVAFEEKGAYNVTLAVTDNGGITETTSVTVPVSEPPVAAFEYEPGTIGQNRSVTFDASDSRDPDGRVTTYVWEFGDGRTMEGETVNRRFSELGNQSVNLTVADDATLRNASNQTVTVHPVPDASIDADPEAPVEGSEIEFQANSDDDVDSYEWDFGDGAADATGETATHVYDEAGEYTVSVDVTSGAGVTNRTNRTMTIDRNATFELTSNRGTIQRGDTAIITFTISNNIPDRQLNARLQFALPEAGVSISSVEGGDVEGRGATDFVTVDGGEQQTLRVRMQFNEPGAYNISGQSVYYYGNQSSSQEQSVGPVNVQVEDPDEGIGASGPGFDVGTVIAGVIGLLAVRRLRRG